MRKIYIVPNFVTTINMACGFYSVIATLNADYVGAAWAIIAASVFDMLDGRIARLAKATSQFGVEYDSLSDLISFGMAPAVLIYRWALEPYGRFGWLAAFLFMACGALRLARFNVNSGSLPKGFFQGLPIPMGAGTVATFVIFTSTLAGSGLEASRDTALRQAAMLVITLLMGSLMISTIRFPSFKELNWRSRASFGILMIGVMSMILIAVKPEITLFLLISSYITVSLCWNLARLALGRGAGKNGVVTNIKDGSRDGNSSGI